MTIRNAGGWTVCKAETPADAQLIVECVNKTSKSEVEMKYYIEVVEFESGEVVSRMEASSERTAEKIDRGVNINLNHENYYTRITEEESEL